MRHFRSLAACSLALILTLSLAVPASAALKQLQDALNDLWSATFEFHTMLPRHCQTRIRLRRQRIRPAARRRLPFRLPFRPIGLARGEDLAHGLAHRLLVAGANHLPVAIAVHEGIAASRLLIVIEKKRLMCQPANQVVASAILYKPRLPHVEQCITRPITMPMLLCQ